mmetsp:Transcript_19216/g.30010  ORF Transcript_19216/g.30010 Transcript_19216/m.30010 type:complete len:110 (-) Transcript_19216:414-743(-)
MTRFTFVEAVRRTIVAGLCTALIHEMVNGSRRAKWRGLGLGSHWLWCEWNPKEWSGEQPQGATQQAVGITACLSQILIESALKSRVENTRGNLSQACSRTKLNLTFAFL